MAVADRMPQIMSRTILEGGYCHPGMVLMTMNKILCMHLYGDGLQRKLERYAQKAAKMSKANIHFHLSDFYLEDPCEIMTDFMNNLRRSRSLKKTFKLSDD